MLISSFTHKIVHNPEPEDVDTIQISVCITKICQSIELFDLYVEVIEPSSVPVSLRENMYLELTEFLIESGAVTSIDDIDALVDLSRLVDEVTSSDDYTPDCALRVWMNLTIVCPSNQIDEEEVQSLLDESDDVIFDFNHPTEEAAPSQTGEVVQVSFNDTIEEEVLGLEDDQNIIFVLDHQTEEAARSQIEEIFQISFNENNTVRLRPASKLAVCSFSRKIYNKTNDCVGEIEICTICLEEFKDGRRIVTLPCGHDFDEECILEWFVSSHTCPLCRLELPCEDEK